MLTPINKVVKKDQHSIQAIFETGPIVAGLLALILLLPHQLVADDLYRFQGLSELLNQGKLSNMRYSLVGPAFSIPFWLLGKVYETSAWWRERYNLFLFASIPASFALATRLQYRSTSLLLNLLTLLILLGGH